MTKIQIYIVVFGVALIGILSVGYWMIHMKDAYASLNNIKNKDVFNQTEDEYYIYYYKKDCPYCKRVENLIMNLGKSKENLFVVDMGKKQNTKSYDWKNHHMGEDKEIGIINLDNSINLYDGESEEKYQTQGKRNKFGKIKTYEIVKADENYILENGNARIGYVYVSIQTPEIDYENATNSDDIVIAGVPTLLHIKDGKIDGFYFDAPEIAEHLGKMQ